jgi:hypothetical protein
MVMLLKLSTNDGALRFGPLKREGEMARHLPALALAIAYTAVLGGCSHRTRAAAKTLPPPESIDELKAAMAKILTRTHVPGVGIALVTKDGVNWTGGVGKPTSPAGERSTATRCSASDRSPRASSPCRCLRCRKRAGSRWTQNSPDLAPEVPIVNPWEQTDPVRIANLLEHSAGFDDFPLAEFYDFSGRDDVPLLKTLQMFPEPQHVRWRPGTFFSYSNPGYGVAGYLVEKISGQLYEDYIASNILRPLGMIHSDMRLTPEVKATLAQGYEFDPPRAVPYLPILLRSAGEMKSSPNEMARFVRMMLNRGSLEGTTVVSPDSLTRMETAETTLASRSGLR